MREIALVSCVKGKLDHPAKAKDLYQSDWFRKARCYAERHCDEWYILSAEHYLLDPERVIDPYEKTLNRMGKVERINWSLRVHAMILDLPPPDTRLRCSESEYADDKLSFVILAGNRYREFLVPLLHKNGFEVEMPMEGMGIGMQMKFLGESCDGTHSDRD